MEWIVTGLLVLLAYYLFILRPGRIDFWKLAAKHPELAYELFDKHDCWVVFAEKPPGGYKNALPDGDWDGPFKLAVPQHAWKTVTIYGRVPDYEKTQQEFIDALKKLA